MHTELYDRLGVTTAADSIEIKKAYRKLALKWHPDKNTNNKTKAEEEFKKVSEAYSILSNPEKREKYDNYGLKGMNNMTNHNASNIFEMFFGGNSNPFAKKKGKQILEVKISLQDIYTGCLKKLKITRKKQCLNCFGKGAKKLITCTSCRGAGVIIQKNQIAPGFIQQIQITCSFCQGVGSSPDRHNICLECNGDGRIDTSKIIEYKVPKGAKNGEKQLFVDYGNETCDGEKTDLILVLKQKSSQKYERKKDDLIFIKPIRLGDALTGVEWEHTHISGEILYIKENTVITDKMLKYIKGYGMPKKNGTAGDLIIIYQLIYPKQLCNKDLCEHLEITYFKRSPFSKQIKTLIN